MTRLTKKIKRLYAEDRKYFKTKMGGGYVLPRLTHKYFNAVSTLSTLDGTSISIYHLTAASKGTSIFYDELEKMGYIWNTKKKKWIPPNKR